MNKRTYTRIREALEDDDGVDETEFRTIDTLLRSLVNRPSLTEVEQ